MSGGEGIRITRREWRRFEGAVWEEIESDDDWLLAYLPYQDEPVRCAGSSIVHSKPSSDGTPGSPLLLALLGRLDERLPHANRANR